MDPPGTRTESKSLFAQVLFYILQTEQLQGDSARDVRISNCSLKGSY